MIEDTWYRLWSHEEDRSKIVDKEVIDDLIDREKVEFSHMENFYDATFGNVVVLHYAYRPKEW